MFSRSAVHAVAQALLKRAERNEVDWQWTGGDEYTVELSDFLVSLARQGDANVESITFEVRTLKGNLVGRIDVKANDAEFDELNRLLDFAESFAARWDEQLLNAALAISRGTGRVGAGSSSGTTTFSPPPLPKRPSEEQAQRFFEKIAGKWTLIFETSSGGRGTEVLEIDNAGNYFTLTTIRGADVARSVYPRYRLLLLSCDDDLNHVEISKQELNGKQRQIEVLRVSDQEMDGYAKHDEHLLAYKRR